VWQGFQPHYRSQQSAETAPEALPPLGILHAGAAAALPSGLLIHQHDIHSLKERLQ